MINSSRQILYAALGLLVCLLVFEVTPLDLWVQQFFFDVSTQQWLWSGTEPLSRLLLYDGIKKLLVVFALILLISLFCCRYSVTLHRYRSGIRIVLLSLLLVPLSVSALKANTNVACPRALAGFSGKLPYVGVLEPYPAGQQPPHRQRCFPAGHASGGFALLSLFFLFKSNRNRKGALAFALVIGWLMGGYKMLIGDHFLSHTLVSMLLAWLIINAIVKVDVCWPRSLHAHPVITKEGDIT